MADNDTPNTEAATNQAAAGPQLIINAQYIKDLSFENPRAPQSLIAQNKQPEVGLNVDVKARTLGQDMYEVMLTINANAQIDNEPVFLVELSYGAVVTLQGASEDMVAGALLVETPRLMFPFARNIIAEATRDGGFPPLFINPIDFAELVRRDQAARMAAGEQGNGATAQA
jgi:preprotein translocase subunit SecB